MTSRSDTTRRVLDALDASGRAALVAAIERAGRFVASGKPLDKNVEKIGARLAAIAASEERWQVRLAVARAANALLLHDAFPRVVAPLLEDSNFSVRKAAQRVWSRREDAGRANYLQRQRGDLLKDALFEIEKEPGPRAARRALRAAYGYADSLLSIARHESQNNLLAIRGCLDGIVDAVDQQRAVQQPSTVREEVEIARRQLEAIEELMKSLKEMTPDLSLEVRNEDLGWILHAAFDQLVRYNERKKRQHVDVEITPGRFTVDGNRDRLLRAFTNLLDNAIEAYQGLDDIEARPPIVVEARMDGRKRVLIEFRDGGRGIPERQLARVCELFVSTKSKRGSGIGLAVARNIIVHEHRGTLKIESEVGKGTVVRISLPTEQEGAH